MKVKVKDIDLMYWSEVWEVTKVYSDGNYDVETTGKFINWKNLGWDMSKGMYGYFGPPSNPKKYKLSCVSTTIIRAANAAGFVELEVFEIT